MGLHKRIRFYSLRNLELIPQIRSLSSEAKFSIKAVSRVLPFRTNNYIVNELIDWNAVPNDPIFQLTFPQRGMLEEKQYAAIADSILRGESQNTINQLADTIRFELNPHPAGQKELNVPNMDNTPLQGIQHKYKETCLVFPSAGQTCHAYCTYCFRWAQFIRVDNGKFSTVRTKRYLKYIEEHKEITDVLFTGGDPMIMTVAKLKDYILPFLQPEFEHVNSIRIGTKVLSFWPYKFTIDKESSELLQFFEEIVNSGKHLAIMAHFSHGNELKTNAVRSAIEKIRGTGAEIRSQAPIVKHINNEAAVWAEMWKEQVRLGIIPYYMFVERNTGAKNYFEIPLAEAFRIFKKAYSSISGLARTVKGPSMSALPGKVNVDGISEVNGEKVFVLNFIQARNPDWVKIPFFAEYDENATWLTDLKPAFGKKKFFYEDELEEMKKRI